MDNEIPFSSKQIILKSLWDNVFQVLAFLIVFILLIVSWSSLETNIKIGAIVLFLAYLLIRLGIAYQQLRFSRQIEREKTQQNNREYFKPDI